MTASLRTLSVSTPIHGRVLVRDIGAPDGLLIGFHGYKESAAIQMERLAAIPGAERWTLVSAQGLHRFYKGATQEVVASWMTRQDRELAIEDNVEYANRVVAATRLGEEPVVTIGFSQGAAMAFRAAVRGMIPAAAVIAVGGDIPPELLADSRSDFPRVLLTRGRGDEWYTADKLAKDVAALRARGVDPEILEFDGGHEWTPEIAAAAGRFLR